LPVIELVKEGENELVRASGTAIFDKKMKLVGELNEEETKGLLWINNKVQFGTVVCQTQTQNMVSCEIIDANTEVDVLLEGDKIKYTIQVTCALNIDQVDGKESNALSRQQMQEIEVACAETIRTQISSALQKCLGEYRSDVFRFGKRLWQKYPETYREISDNWRESFELLEFETRVKTQVSKTGEEGIDINE
jgi:spore germination protein KC